MAPKRQSAILPQPKKPRPAAAPKLEDKSASPGLPKGGKFLHCVSLVIDSVIGFFCDPPSPDPFGDEIPTNTRESFRPGAAENEADVGEGESAELGDLCTGDFLRPGTPRGTQLALPSPQTLKWGFCPGKCSSLRPPHPSKPESWRFKPAQIFFLLLEPPAHNSGLNYCHLVQLPASFSHPARAKS